MRKRQSVQEPRGSLTKRPHRSTVLVVDDDIAVADPLSRFLKLSYRVLPYLTDIDAVDEVLKQTRVDVIIHGVVFPNGQLLTTRLAALSDTFRETAVIVATGFPDQAPVELMLAFGAKGYLLKPMEFAEVRLAVDTAIRGGIYITRDARAQLHSRYPRLAITDEENHEEALARVEIFSGFTRCLAEVGLLKHGRLSDKQAAGRLGIPLHTLKGRRRRIRTEFGIESLAELILMVEHALLEPPRPTSATAADIPCGSRLPLPHR